MSHRSPPLMMSSAQQDRSGTEGTEGQVHSHSQKHPQSSEELLSELSNVRRRPRPQSQESSELESLLRNKRSRRRVNPSKTPSKEPPSLSRKSPESLEPEPEPSNPRSTSQSQKVSKPPSLESLELLPLPSKLSKAPNVRRRRFLVTPQRSGVSGIKSKLSALELSPPMSRLSNNRLRRSPKQSSEEPLLSELSKMPNVRRRLPQLSHEPHSAGQQASPSSDPTPGNPLLQTDSPPIFSEGNKGNRQEWVGLRIEESGS